MTFRMKTPQQNRTDLLDDLLNEDSGAEIPDQENIIALVRREKVARKRRRSLAAALACAGVIMAGAFLATPFDRAPAGYHALSGDATSGEVAQNDEPRDIRIERINDEQLLALLDDQPAALVQFPNGERRLLIIVQARPQ